MGVFVSIAFYTRFYWYSAYDADVLALGYSESVGVLMWEIPEEDVVIAIPESSQDELFSLVEFADIIGYLEDCKREIENRDNYYDPKQIRYIEGIVARLERLYDAPAMRGDKVLMRRIS